MNTGAIAVQESSGHRRVDPTVLVNVPWLAVWR